MKFLTLVFTFLLTVSSGFAQKPSSELPYFKHENGRHALMVDGKPYLILGAQSNNSSTWPATLPEVWSAMGQLHVNTLEIPIYWEQFEPKQGVYDYSVVDAVVTQAREHNVRLVLLWFATWKNGSNHYMPQWMKLQPKKYPNMKNKDVEFIDSPSPHSSSTLEADKTAFAAFMAHLKEIDPQHTVIMVQVQNEPGSWDTDRDYSKEAQRLFEQPVPNTVLKAMNVKPKSNKNWEEVFGQEAGEFFHVWYVATFIEEVAKAGKEIYPLPLYVNAAIRNPFQTDFPRYYQRGGPNDNVFELWQAAAPSIELVAPDIYFGDHKSYAKAIELYAREDNALFIPETFWHAPYPKYLFAALGHGAIGYAPFGLDDTRIRTGDDGDVLDATQMYEPTALNYKLLKPMASEIAQWNFEGKLKAVIQIDKIDESMERGNSVDKVNYVTDTSMVFKDWKIDVAFGKFNRMSRAKFQSEHADGRLLAVELNDNQFLLAGYMARVMFQPIQKKANSQWQYLTVEEGHYENGEFVMERILNGDQTDWGLNFDEPKVLRVSLYMR